MAIILLSKIILLVPKKKIAKPMGEIFRIIPEFRILRLTFHRKSQNPIFRKSAS